MPLLNLNELSSVNQAEGHMPAAGFAVLGADLADDFARSDQQSHVERLHRFHLLVVYLWSKDKQLGNVTSLLCVLLHHQVRP